MCFHITLGRFVGVPSLPEGAHDDAAVTYAFCRLVDDVVDEAPSEQAASEGVQALEAELRGDALPSALVRGFSQVMLRDGGSLDAAFELIKGVRSDLDEQIVQDESELLYVRLPSCRNSWPYDVSGASR